MNISVAYPDLIDAVVLYAPVSSDYLDNYNKWTKKRIKDDEKTNLKNIIWDLTLSELWKSFSPRNYFLDIEDPILIHHWSKDNSCPLDWSLKTLEYLEQLKKNVTFYKYEGAKHEFINHWPLFMDRNLVFFNKYLKD